jgi:hypothetical protein
LEGAGCGAVAQKAKAVAIVFPHLAHFPHLPRDNPVDSRGRLFNIAVLIPARGAPRANYSSTYLDELKVLR